MTNTVKSVLAALLIYYQSELHTIRNSMMYTLLKIEIEKAARSQSKFY